MKSAIAILKLVNLWYSYIEGGIGILKFNDCLDDVVFKWSCISILLGLSFATGIVL